jgi:hypothetical protein
MSCQCIGDVADSTPKAQIEKALREPLNASGLDFTEQPLSDVAQFIADEYKIPVYVAVEDLTEAGIAPDEPVTVKLQQISLQSALRLMLKSKNLTYIVRNEVLEITTRDAANAALTICVYDVRDLVKPGDDVELARLVDAIVSCVTHGSWSQNGGGDAQIRALQPGVLVVSQTDATHRQIGALLGAVRRIKNGDSTPGAMMGGRAGRYGMFDGEGAVPFGESRAGGAEGREMGRASRGASVEGENLFGPAGESPFGGIEQTKPPVSGGGEAGH